MYYVLLLGIALLIGLGISRLLSLNTQNTHVKTTEEILEEVRKEMELERLTEETQNDHKDDEN